MKFMTLLILLTGVSAVTSVLEARSPGKSRKKPESFLETFSPSKTTIRNNAREQTGLTRSRTPSPRPRQLPPDPTFRNWIDLNRDAIQESKSLPAGGRASSGEMLRIVVKAKSAAKTSRNQADADLAKFRRDPKHFDKALESAEDALVDGSLSSQVQNNAVIHYTNTDRNSMVPDMIKSGARELARTRVRGSYKSAWHAEHLAKLTTVAASRRKPNDPGRGDAYALAAKARKDFHEASKVYYDHYDEYKYTKQEMGTKQKVNTKQEMGTKQKVNTKQEMDIKQVIAGGNSSSEEEWDFHGYPRKYR